MTDSTNSTKLLPLNDIHLAFGAKMVDFAGWKMPVQYKGLPTEHLAVRTAAGLFDVSHMGEIEVTGTDALNLLQYVTCNDVSKLSLYQIQYSALMNESGGFVDDILVHRIAPEHFLCCVNASNIDKDFAWINKFVQNLNVQVVNTSQNYVQLALQGPRSEEILQTCIKDIDLRSLKYYRCLPDLNISGLSVLLTRTGYTGEDGFEIYCSPKNSVELWTLLMKTGEQFGLIPAGLGARNTLRLEAKMALYGNDINETTTILEADLGWICKINKGEFLGSKILKQQKTEGIKRKLVGFEVDCKVPVRDGYIIFHNEKEIGKVTSGSPSPSLKKNIGLAYLPIELANLNTEFSVMVRDQKVQAHVVETPFYKRITNLI